MKDFRRAVVLAVVLAVLVAVAAWATTPDEHTVPPTIVPVLGERPAAVQPAGDDAPDYTICGQVDCPIP